LSIVRENVAQAALTLYTHRGVDQFLLQLYEPDTLDGRAFALAGGRVLPWVRATVREITAVTSGISREVINRRSASSQISSSQPTGRPCATHRSFAHCAISSWLGLEEALIGSVEKEGVMGNEKRQVTS
jgi:hypothetical protein